MLPRHDVVLTGEPLATRHLVEGMAAGQTPPMNRSTYLYHQLCESGYSWMHAQEQRFFFKRSPLES